MTFYEPVDPIEDRALRDGGDLVLSQIARAKATPGDLSTAQLSRRLRWGKDGKRVFHCLQSLENAGFVTLNRHGDMQVRDATLTAKGWDRASQMGHKVPLEVMG